MFDRTPTEPSESSVHGEGLQMMSAGVFSRQFIGRGRELAFLMDRADPAVRAPGDDERAWLLATIEASGLRGRGGGERASKL